MTSELLELIITGSIKFVSIQLTSKYIIPTVHCSDRLALRLDQETSCCFKSGYAQNSGCEQSVNVFI